MSDFDIDLEVKKLKLQTSIIRKTYYRKSRLDRYQGELLSLHRAGVSCAELQRFLRTKRIKVAYSTVSRWLTKNA